jgi:pimeloyl-ACP methyl ester carboxylesterase
MTLVSTTGDWGRPVVLIHGLALSSLTWRLIIPTLSQVFSCYAVDLPGHGKTPPPVGFTFTLNEYALFIQQFVLDSNLENVILVGHSLGGTIATLSLLIDPCQEYRDRIGTLCVIDGPCHPLRLPYFLSIPRIPIIGTAVLHTVPASIQMRYVLRSSFYDAKKIDERQEAAYSELLERPSTRKTIQKIANSIDQEQLESYTRRLHEIDKNTIIIWGHDDKIIPRKYAELLHRDILGSRLIIFSECGHMPQEERPMDTVEYLMQNA